MRRRLLFVSPIMPARTGNGLAMRAGMMLEALAADHDVYLQVIPVAGGAAEPPRPIGRRCAGLDVQSLAGRADPLFGLIGRIREPEARRAALARYPRPALCRFATTAAVSAARGAFPGVSFDEVHVFRLYMAPFVAPLMGGPAGPICRLDLDDVESRTRERLAALHAADGGEEAAALERSEALKFAVMERAYLPRFDRVYVCSPSDRQVVAGACPDARLAVVPNGVRLPPPSPARAHGRAPFTFIFVGNLGYAPNEDAAVHFCAEILPRVRAAVRAPVRVLIVGPGAGPRVQALAGDAIAVTGAVPDVAPYYADADAAIVPIRAGGGSRIKLLEALAHRRPVVSTVMGAEGIAVRNGREALLAESPAEFAAACARLAGDPALARALARRGRAFAVAHHAPQRILDLLRRDHGPRCQGRGRRSTR